MPQVPEYIRRARLSSSAGNVINTSQPDRSGEAAIGQAFTQLGADFYQNIKEAEYKDQLNNAQMKVLNDYYDYQSKLGPDTTNYLSGLEELQNNTVNGINFTNGKAQSEFESWYANQRLQQKKSITDYKNSVDADNFKNNFNNNILIAKNLAASSATEQDYQNIIFTTIANQYGVNVTENGGLELNDQWYNPLFDNNEARMAGAKAFIEDAARLRLKEQTYQAALVAEDGELLIRNSGLLVEDQKDVLQDYNFVMAGKENELDIEKERIATQTWQLAADGDFAAAAKMIRENSSSFGSDWATDEINKARNAATLYAMDGKNPFTETQSEKIRWDLQQRAEKYDLTLEELDSHVGIDISIKDRDEIKKLLKEGMTIENLRDSYYGNMLVGLVQDIPYADEDKPFAEEKALRLYRNSITGREKPPTDDEKVSDVRIIYEQMKSDYLNSIKPIPENVNKETEEQIRARNAEEDAIYIEALKANQNKAGSSYTRELLSGEPVGSDINKLYEKMKTLDTETLEKVNQAIANGYSAKDILEALE